MEENWYSKQLEIEVIQGIRDLENSQDDFKLIKVDYDVDSQTIDIFVKVSFRSYRKLFAEKDQSIARMMRLYLKKEILDNFSNRILAKPMRCTLKVRGFLFQGYKILYSGEIHNRSYEYARY